jgi:voltage-gated potassium channel
MLREKLYIIIFGTNTKAGRLFDVVLLWLILLSVTVVILESLPDESLALHITFSRLEWGFTILFTLEYLLRIWTSPKPLKYIFSFWGIIDFVSVLPTFISLLFPGYHYLLVVRILRLLRIFRILKLVRLSTEARILANALKTSSYKIGIFLYSVVTIITILGTLMYVIEGEKSGFNSIPQGIYWAIVTVTTVGYGDIVPLSVLGKFLSAFAMILGYAIIAVPTGIVTVELSKSQKTTIHCNHCKQDNPVNAIYCFKCGKEMHTTIE